MPDLKGQTLLLLEDGHCLRDQALEVCSRIDVREAEDFRATSLETLRQMVVAGLGITLLPELAVESPFGSQRGLTIRQFGKPAPRRTVGAVWRKSSTRAGRDRRGLRGAGGRHGAQAPEGCGSSRVVTAVCDASPARAAMHMPIISHIAHA